MLINLRKQVIPTFDQSAFVLVSNQFYFIFGPAVLDVFKKLFKNKLTSCFTENFHNNFIVFYQVCLPEIIQDDIIELYFYFELDQHLLPMAWLHRFALKFEEHGIRLSVFLEKSFVFIIN